MSEDDPELMRRVQAGDTAAFGRLMDEWELPVKRLLARLVQNAADAEELAQETFVRVWRQRARYRTDAPFRPWLFAIALNLGRNRLRWWRRRPQVSLEAWTEAGGEARSEQPEASELLERRERMDAVRAAIAALPAGLREVIVLFQYEELSQREIALAVGLTEKAVESRLYRARSELRARLVRPAPE